MVKQKQQLEVHSFWQQDSTVKGVKILQIQDSISFFILNSTLQF